MLFLGWLGLGGLSLRNTSLIFTRALSVSVLSRRLKAGSTNWMISSIGMDLGVRAKFIPNDSTYISVGVRERWLRLTMVCLWNASYERRCGGCYKDIR